MIGIGIDTGGTCTDAAVYDLHTREVLAVGKTLTTKANLEIGIGLALDQLPEELVNKAQSVALSTTLATNACVENKGARAKLLIIGTSPEMVNRLREVLEEYGIEDLSQLIVLDARPEHLFSEPYDPDWEELQKDAPGLFADCDCVGIVQMFPNANGGRFELTALRILQQELTIPVTIAYEISRETDILKVCASTLLNARLIPLIAEFMEAVHHVLERRGIHAPLSIVRSDGTLMSEEMARTCPVETLLCGPAASVIGGCTLAGTDDAILADMGGTTTDIALVRRREPVRAEKGIHIGQFRTSIKGLDARAVSLGGDTAVRFRDGALFLDKERVIPISTLAAQHPEICTKLRRLNEAETVHTRWIHEFYVLLKDFTGKSGFTEDERRICAVLKDGPLIMRALAQALGTDVYHLRTERLEQEGIIIRSGLTPTDMMLLKGDYQGAAQKQPDEMLRISEGNSHNMAKEAAKEMVVYIARNIACAPETIPDQVYELVTRTLYKSLGAFLLQSKFPRACDVITAKGQDALLEWFYEDARERCRACGVERSALTTEDGITVASDIASLSLTCDLPLVGIGAPIHVFLPKVAQLLHTRAIIPPYAHVANAVGAACAPRTLRMDLPVTVQYDGFQVSGYHVVAECRRETFLQMEDAVTFARETLYQRMRERAAFQGLGEDAAINIWEEEKRIGGSPKGLLLEIILHACTADVVPN